MYSPSLEQLLVKAHVEELHRRTNRHCLHARRAREIHPRRAASLTLPESRDTAPRRPRCPGRGHSLRSVVMTTPLIIGISRGSEKGSGR